MKRNLAQLGGAQSPPPAKRQKRMASTPNYQSTGFGRSSFSLQIQSQPTNTNNVPDPAKVRRLKVERDVVNEIKDRKYSQEGVDLHKSIYEVSVISRRHEIELTLPELAVVGMQSDGKSSFVEALMGFKFNVTSTELGTRRPLIITMNNKPGVNVPRIFFLEEGTLSRNDNPTPLENVEKEIIRRTDAVCGRDAISGKPIVMEVEYCHCSNLTIYDFPGFRKSEDDPLGDKIEDMVLEIIRGNPNLFIVCLEQSTVEWVNTQVKPIIEQVDPRRNRTMFVSTKFNNRINQFREPDEVNRFIQNGVQAAYPADIFFMSLPSGIRSHGLTPTGFKERLVDTHMDDFQALIEVGFDEKKYLPLIGFHRVEDHLRRILFAKYRNHLHPIQQKILGVLINAQRESQAIQNRIDEKEKLKVKDYLGERIHDFVVATRKGLNGSTDFIGLGAGLTLEEERGMSRCMKWPGYDENLSLNFRNAGLRLFGGAQIDRLINEFETVAHSMEFRKVSPSEVATALGLGGLFGSARGGYGQDLVRASSDLAARNSRTAFTPLVKVLMNRSVFLMDHLFTKVGEYLETESESSYEWMKLKSLAYVSDLLEELRKKVLEELETFTKVLDWEFISDLLDNHQQQSQDEGEGESEDEDEDDDDEFVGLNDEFEEEEEEENGDGSGFADDEFLNNTSLATSTISRSMVANSTPSSSRMMMMRNDNNNDDDDQERREESPQVLGVIPPPPPPNQQQQTTTYQPPPPSSSRKNRLSNNNNRMVPPPMMNNHKQQQQQQVRRGNPKKAKKKVGRRRRMTGGRGRKNKKKNKKRASNNNNYNFLDPSKEDTVSRVLRHTRRNSTFLNPMVSGKMGQRGGHIEMNSNSSDKIQMVAAKLFSGIRLMFVRFVKMKYTLDFLQPFLEGGLEGKFRSIFNDLKEDDIREIISVTIDADKKKKERIDDQIRDINLQHVKLSNLKKKLEKQKRKSVGNGGNGLMIE